MKSILLKYLVSTMKIKDKIQLTATVKPSTTTKQSLTYTTSDANIATVSSKGVVTAISVGTVTLTATAKDGTGVRGSVTIEVLTEEIPTEPVSPGAIN